MIFAGERNINKKQTDRDVRQASPLARLITSRVGLLSIVLNM